MRQMMRQRRSQRTPEQMLLFDATALLVVLALFGVPLLLQWPATVLWIPWALAGGIARGLWESWTGTGDTDEKQETLTRKRSKQP